MSLQMDHIEYLTREGKISIKSNVFNTLWSTDNMVSMAKNIHHRI